LRYFKLKYLLAISSIVLSVILQKEISRCRSFEEERIIPQIECSVISVR
ncbi:7894_t:CDS:1, partial [Funneliformis geosporum]